MPNISILIITKNESKHIVDCINSAKLISNDIIVVDSGSIDDTIELAESLGAKVISINWKGYGDARNIGTIHTKHDWVLALDADERITNKVANAINGTLLDNPHIIYGFKIDSFFIDKKVRFGEWGRDKVWRLYNKKVVNWNLNEVHEGLVGADTKRIMIKNCSFLHYTVDNLEEYNGKIYKYAQLSADKYLQKGKKYYFLQQLISPLFSFIQNYIFRLGFLDGVVGWTIAAGSSKYNWLKYKYLAELKRKAT
jgi:glycosyltransferase involved in cell wall biosynthesis